MKPRREAAVRLVSRLPLSNLPTSAVLDLNLPRLDGFSVIDRLSEEKCSSRVLNLTARGEIEHRVRGLKAGADDYLAKPFSMDELMARVEALGRRGIAPSASNLLDVADLHLDVRERRFDLGRYRADEEPEPSRLFDKAGLVTLRCDIHEHMRALILVLDTPYFVTTDTEGRFKLAGLPAGKYKLKAWLDSKTTLEVPVELVKGAALKVNFE